jgi:NAD(P)H-dependent FMN reductase
MSQYQIAVVVGSLRRDSFNRKLATAVVKLAPPEFAFRQVQIGDLPLYNQDDDASQADAVKRLKAEIIGSHGVLFVTAEYNRSIPGVLKNAIDHASRPYGESAWAGKPAAILGVSVGASGTGDSTAAFAQCLRLPGHADAWHTRSVHSRKGRVVRRGREHRTRQQGISPGLDGQVCHLGETARRLMRSRICTWVANKQPLKLPRISCRGTPRSP